MLGVNRSPDSNRVVRGHCGVYPRVIAAGDVVKDGEWW